MNQNTLPCKFNIDTVFIPTLLLKSQDINPKAFGYTLFNRAAQTSKENTAEHTTFLFTTKYMYQHETTLINKLKLDRQQILPQ